MFLVRCSYKVIMVRINMFPYVLNAHRKVAVDLRMVNTSQVMFVRT